MGLTTQSNGGAYLTRNKLLASLWANFIELWPMLFLFVVVVGLV